MEQMPQKPGLKHDKDYGTIKIINKKILDIKSMKKIKFLCKLYFIINLLYKIKSLFVNKKIKVNPLCQDKGVHFRSWTSPHASDLSVRTFHSLQIRSPSE